MTPGETSRVLSPLGERDRVRGAFPPRKLPLDQAAARGPNRILLPGDFLHRAPRRDRVRRLLQDIPARHRLRILVIGLEQQPLLLLIARPAFGADQVPAPVELLAIEVEREVALGVTLRRIAFRAPEAAVPDHDRAAAVLAFGDDPLEISVIDGVVLDVDGEALFAGVETWPLGYRPALEHTPEFQPEIVMQPAGRMLLNHEAEPLAGRLRKLAAWLWGFREIALFTVAAEIALNGACPTRTVPD